MDFNLKFEELKELFAKRFVKFDEPLQALLAGYMSEENIVLWGQGGFGKSDMTKYFFECVGKKPFVKALGQGTSIDELFGGMDMKLYKDTGEIRYMPERSFMNHEVVVLEEAWDAQPFVLEQLKEVLQSKEFSFGDTSYKLKTKVIVVCTNRNRKDYAEDLSIGALMERFPLECKVEWKHQEIEDYAELLDVVFDGEETSAVNDTLFDCMGKGRVSPRTYVKAAGIFMKCGIDALRYVVGFDALTVDQMREAARRAFASQLQATKWRKLFASINTLPQVNFETASFEEIGTLIAKSEDVIGQLNDFTVTDEIADMRHRMTEVWKTYKEELVGALTDKSRGSASYANENKEEAVTEDSSNISE